MIFAPAAALRFNNELPSADARTRGFAVAIGVALIYFGIYVA
jgi:hypothetical protein